MLCSEFVLDLVQDLNTANHNSIDRKRMTLINIRNREVFTRHLPPDVQYVQAYVNGHVYCVYVFVQEQCYVCVAYMFDYGEAVWRAWVPTQAECDSMGLPVLKESLTPQPLYKIELPSTWASGGYTARGLIGAVWNLVSRLVDGPHMPAMSYTHESVMEELLQILQMHKIEVPAHIRAQVDILLM